MYRHGREREEHWHGGGLVVQQESAAVGGDEPGGPWQLADPAPRQGLVPVRAVGIVISIGPEIEPINSSVRDLIGSTS